MRSLTAANGPKLRSSGGVTVQPEVAADLIVPVFRGCDHRLVVYIQRLIAAVLQPTPAASIPLMMTTIKLL